MVTSCSLISLFSNIRLFLCFQICYHMWPSTIVQKLLYPLVLSHGVHYSIHSLIYLGRIHCIFILLYIIFQTFSVYSQCRKIWSIYSSFLHSKHLLTMVKPLLCKLCMVKNLFLATNHRKKSILGVNFPFQIFPHIFSPYYL